MRALPFAAAALLAAVLSAPAHAAATPAETATQIRAIEESGAFTPPTPRAEFILGRFDAANGTFTGTKTKDVCHYDIELREIICEPGPPPRTGSPRRPRRPMSLPWRSRCGGSALT